MNMMKKTLLVSAVLTALTGCEEDYKGKPAAGENVAPTHSGNISATFHEKDSVKRVYLLGTTQGLATGKDDNGTLVATDANGDYLQIKNLQASTEDLTGFAINDGIIVVRPSELVDSLDTGETKSVTFTYEISDGDLSVARTATINVEGEDFAPEVSAIPLVANYTKDVTSGNVDLLLGVTDADNEPLTASNIQADSNNPFDIPVSIDNNQASFDIASVKNQIPDGQKLTFSFSYDIKDHNHTVSRNFTVNLLGVSDVPGAPLVGNYFINDTLDETAEIKTYDLIEGAIDREGDAIVVQDFTVNGDAGLVYGFELNGTDLTFNPRAFLSEVAAGESKQLLVKYKVADDKGNISDGEKELAITLNGVESNIFAQNGFDYNFESSKSLSEDGTGWQVQGWPGGAVQKLAASARSGSFGLSFAQESAVKLPMKLEPQRQYYLSTWYKKSSTAKPDFFLVQPEGAILWNNGTRPWLAAADSWQEVIIPVDSTDSKYSDMTLEAGGFLYILNGSGVEWTDAPSDIDDVSFVDITNFGGEAYTALETGVGSFEDPAATIATNGEGTVEIKASAKNSGEYGLFVDTSGKTEYAVNVELPIKAGAIKAGGRYMLEFDMHHINGPEAASTAYDVTISTANGQVLAYGSTWGNWYQTTRVNINTEAATGSPDWANEEVKLTILLKAADAQFNIDNVRLYDIP
ncbi:hypothetical protein [Catenovulum agarivorans]|nr:hypothetical protein [Catenovulum agarivorans]